MTIPSPGAPLLIDGVLTAEGLRAPPRLALAALIRDRAGQVVSTRDHLRAPTARDPEALHDFRVALRRFRSLFRAYRPELHVAGAGGVRKGLRRIARATNASRDLEVKLDWLAIHAQTVRSRDRVGLRWLQREFRQAKREADQMAWSRIDHDLAPALARMERLLLRVQSLGEGAVGAGGPDMHTRMMAGLQALAARFHRRLERVRALEQQAEIHRARIAGKRIRYLLEPLCTEIPEARDGVRQFRRLQNRLGELRDAQVLVDSLAGAVARARTESGDRLRRVIQGGGPVNPGVLRRERRRDPVPGLLGLAEEALARRDRAWSDYQDRFRDLEAALFAPLQRILALDPVRTSDGPDHRPPGRTPTVSIPAFPNGVRSD